jgi:phospholipase/carboxylesterase
VLLLLHGTGGNERDLIPVGRAIAPGANLLSPRGRVLENGMRRFFRRFAEGIFDEDDVRAQAAALAAFLREARTVYGLTGKCVAFGFSNGANIAAALLLLHPEVLDGAALVRAMPPLGSVDAPDLAGKPVIVSAGLNDPIVSADQLERLTSQLQAAGARLEVLRLEAGHGLTAGELPAIQTWLESHGFAAQAQAGDAA